MGLFHRHAVWLYVECSLLQLVGLFLGAQLSTRINQRAFGHLLLGLMCVCAALMFASAAGVKG